MIRKQATILFAATALAVAGVVPVAAQDASPSAAPGGTEGVSIALVRQLAEGDYFQLWESGAQQQAADLGVDLTVYNASGDNARQALDIETAVNAQPDAIIIDHGFAETVAPAAVAALDAGIPVVAFDVNVGDERAVQLEQSDADIAGLALEQLVADTGGEGDVLYVYVAGFAPLDRRDAVWQEVKAANPGLVEVAQIGAVNDSTAATGGRPGQGRAPGQPEREGHLRAVRRVREGRDARGRGAGPDGPGQGLRRGHLDRGHRRHHRRRQPLGRDRGRRPHERRCGRGACRVPQGARRGGGHAGHRAGRRSSRRRSCAMAASRTWSSSPRLCPSSRRPTSCPSRSDASPSHLTA